MKKDYVYRCDQCGNEVPAKKDSPQWQVRHCPECKRTTMHYKVVGGRQ